MKAKFGLFLLPLVCAAGAYAQAVAGFGAVSGTLRDPYGDGLPDTSVVITNDTLGVKRTLTSTDDGMFLAAALPAGTGYNIKASRQGYGTWEYKDFDVSVGSTVSFAVTMQAETETTQVSDGAVFSAAVEDTKFNVSSFVSQRQLRDLPIDARRLEEPILMAPAVTQDRSTGALIFRGEGGTNAFFTDGQLTTNTYFYQTPNIAPQLTADLVREIQPIPAGASSEFGHAFGGIVNASTPSGTNEYHGSVYGFFSNNPWDAADRYAPGVNLARRWEQGGVKVGGPIMAGKLYFFADLETWRGRSNGINQLSSPLLAGPQGNLLASNCKATTLQCTNAINFLSPQLNAIVPYSTSDWTGVARIDYRASDRNTLILEANGLHGRSPNGAVPQATSPDGGLLGSNGLFTEETRFAKADWIATVTGTIANELRIGWYKDRVSTSLNPSLEPSTGPLGIQIAGASVGSNPLFPSTVSENRYQAVENFTWASLSHLLKFGAEFSLNQDYSRELNYGNYVYPSLTAFATDLTNSGTARNYTLFTQSFPNAVTNLHTKVWSIYGQDNWRVSRRLNVMAGVRWEKYGVPQPIDVNTTYYQTGTIATPSNAFAPRVGVNYLLNDKTVIRAGYSWYYQPYTGELLRDLYTGNGIYNVNIAVTPNLSGAPVFPKVIASSTTTPNGTQNILYGNPKLRLPYSEVAFGGIERRLTNTIAITANYIDTRGTKLWTATDMNLPIAPTITKTYTIDDLNGNAVNSYTTPIWNTRNDTSHMQVYQIFNEGFSRYRGATVQIRKAMSYGLSVQASYTWSHTRDNVSGPPAVAFIPASSVPASYAYDQGPSNFDQRNRATINWLWAPNPVKSNSGAARYLLNGWMVSGIATLASGMPATPIVIVNGQQFAGVTMDYPTSLNGSGGWSRLPTLGPNTLNLGSQQVVNARVTKILPFTERVRGMLMFEAYNALNSQYNTSVNNIAYVATSGILHPVPGLGQGNAASGYPFGTNARWCQVAFRVEF
jgi:outer membrane receptor protein involved in Fe transport